MMWTIVLRLQTSWFHFIVSFTGQCFIIYSMFVDWVPMMLIRTWGFLFILSANTDILRLLNISSRKRLLINISLPTIIDSNENTVYVFNRNKIQCHRLKTGRKWKKTANVSDIGQCLVQVLLYLLKCRVSVFSIFHVEIGHITQRRAR